ncbi:MAG: hypothetical protein ACXWLZ_04620 [Rhizomicrobium sp.]
MKIPFERTLLGAYRFAFTNFLSILGIAWFPFLIVGVTAAGLVYSMLPLLNSLLTTGQDKWSETQMIPFVTPLVGSMSLLFVVFILAFAMVNVGLMRKALGQHPGPIYIFFSLGEQVWRMIGAYLLLMLLAWGTMIAFGLGLAVVTFALSKISATVQTVGTALLMLAAIFGGIYAIVRVQFFLPAVVVAEHHIGLRRSWNLGRGNFWRIVGIVILVTLPAYIVFTTLFSVVLQISLVRHAGPLAGIMPHMMQGKMTPEELRQYLTALLSAVAGVWPILAVMELLYMVALTGLSAGAIATAYNLVTGATDSAPPSSSPKAPA